MTHADAGERPNQTAELVFLLIHSFATTSDKSGQHRKSGIISLLSLLLLLYSFLPKIKGGLRRYIYVNLSKLEFGQWRSSP